MVDLFVQRAPASVAQKITMIFFFQHWKTCPRRELPLRTPPASDDPGWYPRWYMLFPVRERWVPQQCGTPPLSIASNTRRSSHHRPHQCRTLARSTAHRTQSPVHSSARGVAQLHVKGVLTLSFPQETSLTPTLREAFLVNKATTPRIAVVMTAIMGRREVGALSLPRLSYPFAGVYLC